MCGISGILHKNNKPVSLEILQKMNRTLAHRGPDDEGYFVKGPVGLAQRRLAIIDLSSGGHQPMTSPDGRFTITFNGEIYNFIELKAGLEKKGVLFSTRSDTEVLLQLYIAEGKSCLSKLNGMFAFCIWDERDKKLFAARDRMGKKPFYYWDTPAHFAFAVGKYPQMVKINLKLIPIDRNLGSSQSPYHPAPIWIGTGEHGFHEH